MKLFKDSALLSSRQLLQTAKKDIFTKSNNSGRRGEHSSPGSICGVFADTTGKIVTFSCRAANGRPYNF